MLLQSIDTENVGYESNTNNIYNILKNINTLFKYLFKWMDMETHTDTVLRDKWCVKKCDFFIETHMHTPMLVKLFSFWVVLFRLIKLLLFIRLIFDFNKKNKEKKLLDHILQC